MNSEDEFAQEIVSAEPLNYLSAEARERGTCSQCGKPFAKSSCGPSHLLAKVELGLI